MTIDQVVAFVSAETDAENIVAILKAIPVWKQVEDRFMIGSQALTIEDYIRKEMAE
jgi:hypothetical protein